MAFLHGKQTEVYLGKYDTSCYFAEYSGSGSVDAPETTTFCKTSKTYLPAGLVDGEMSLNGFYEASTDINPTASTETLDGVLHGWLGTTTIVPVTVPFASSTTATAGDRARIFAGHLTNYEISSAIGDVVKCVADFSANGVVPRSGPLLIGAGQPVTATYTGSSVNDVTATTTKGASANLHFTANTLNGPSTVVIEHSPTGSAWATLWSFSAVAAASTITATSTTTAGTVSVGPYLRARVTTTASTGTATVIVGVTRL